MIRRLLVCLTLSVLVGCGDKTGTIEGKVTVNGKPLKNCTVTYAYKDGGIENSTVAGTTDDNGHYVVEKVPYGELVIGITPPEDGNVTAKRDKEAIARALASGQPVPVPREVVNKSPIPENYFDPLLSGLTYTLNSKKATHNIEIPAP